MENANKVIGDTDTTEKWDEDKCVFCKRNLKGTIPKLLPCFHSSCVDCLSEGDPSNSQSSSKCPICQQDFLRVDVLDNYFMKDLSSTSEGNQSNEKKTTAVCTSCDDKAEASSFCTDCEEYLCDACVQAHQRVRVTKDHIIRHKNDVENEQKMLGSHIHMFCLTHKQEQLKLFCETCDVLTCRDCQLGAHREHKYKFVAEACIQEKQQIENLISVLMDKKKNLDVALSDSVLLLKFLTEREEIIRAGIKDFATSIIMEVGQRARQLIKELKSLYVARRTNVTSILQDIEVEIGKTQHGLTFAQSALESESELALLYSKKLLLNQLVLIRNASCRIPPNQTSVEVNFIYEKQSLIQYIRGMGNLVIGGITTKPASSVANRNSPLQNESLPFSQPINPASHSPQHLPNSYQPRPPQQQPQGRPMINVHQQRIQQNFENLRAALTNNFSMAQVSSTTQDVNRRINSHTVNVPEQSFSPEMRPNFPSAQSSSTFYPPAPSQGQRNVTSNSSLPMQRAILPKQGVLSPQNVPSYPNNTSSDRTYPGVFVQQYQQQKQYQQQQRFYAQQQQPYQQQQQNPLMQQQLQHHQQSQQRQHPPQQQHPHQQQYQHSLQLQHQHPQLISPPPYSHASISTNNLTASGTQKLSHYPPSSVTISQARMCSPNILRNNIRPIPLNSDVSNRGNSSILPDTRQMSHSVGALQTSMVTHAQLVVPLNSDISNRNNSPILPDTRQMPHSVGVSQTSTLTHAQLTVDSQQNQVIPSATIVKREKGTVLEMPSCSIIPASKIKQEKPSSDDLQDVCDEAVNNLLATINADLNNIDGVNELVQADSSSSPSCVNNNSSPGILIDGIGGCKSSSVATKDEVSSPKIVESRSLSQNVDPNEDWCAVCHDGGDLLCCGQCPRVYHLTCHIPMLTHMPKEHENWQCIMCMSPTRLLENVAEIETMGLSGPTLRLCEKVLLELMCQEFSFSFHQPVRDEVAPGYSDIIKNPMDMVTIKNKLVPTHCNHYMRVEDFFADLRLIFSNCYKYNDVDSEVVALGRKLQNFMENLFRKYFPEETEEDKRRKRRKLSPESELVHIY